MSLATNFANTAYSMASVVLGTTNITIGGGSSISCSDAETSHGSDFEDGGFAPDIARTVVILKTTFAAAYTNATSTYVKDTAVVDSITYRVASIDDGAHVIKINLAHQQSG